MSRRFPETRTARQFGKQCESLGFDYATSLRMLHDSQIPIKNEHEFAIGFQQSPPCVHFVGFRGNEYRAAIKIWGRPDFIHRHYDHRVAGDVAPADTVIFAKGDERSPINPYTFNDSECF